MHIDERIKKIMEKMEKLPEKNPEFTCGAFPPEWDKPIKEERVAKFEQKNGIKLPESYKRFITTIAGSGSQPFYGLYSIFDKEQNNVDVSKKFIYTVKKPLDIYNLSEEEYDELDDNYEDKVLAGFLFLCHEGCGMYSILVVNCDDKDTYGTVWYYDLANDAGIFPLINPINKKTMDFLNWLEYYVDKTLELDNDDFFGYGELAWVYEEN